MHPDHDSTQLPDQPAPIIDGRGPDPHPAAPTDSAFDTRVDLAVDGGHAVEWLFGDIDLASCDHVVEIGSLALAEPRVDELVVDLSRVTFLDSTGLGALVQLQNYSRATDKRLALRGVPPSVSKVLTLAHLEDSFGLTTGDAGRC